MSPAETERAPRGSTRVMCRVRPLASSESGSWVGTCGAEVTLAGSPSFSFDGVFPPTASNQAVFEAMRPTLEDVRAGINGAVLAYGQSGAGKSHTMNGGPGDPGVVQRVRRDRPTFPSLLENVPPACGFTLYSTITRAHVFLADLSITLFFKPTHDARDTRDTHRQLLIWCPIATRVCSPARRVA